MHEWRGDYCGDHLPAGIKVILLAKYSPEVLVDLSYCGDNCIPYLMEISREQEVTVVGTRFIDFFNKDLYGESLEGVYVMNDDTYYTDSEKYRETQKYMCDWNEETEEGLILHSEYYKEVEHRLGEKLVRPESSLSKYIKIVNDSE